MKLWLRQELRVVWDVCVCVCLGVEWVVIEREQSGWIRDI